MAVTRADNQGNTQAQHASAAALDAAPDFAAILAGRFMIPAAEAAQLLDRHKVTTPQLLQALIVPAAALARPPISQYHVGAVGLGASGDVYIGVNLEFPGLPLNNSVHAEQFLLSNAAWHGESALVRLAVSAAPCGHCRQLYSELACADDLVFSFPAHAGQPPEEHTLDELLPQRFGPVDLLDVKTTPLLLQPQNNGINIETADHSRLHDRNCGAFDDGTCSRLESCLYPAAEAALEAAQEAYAPYTKNPAGAAIVDVRGDIHRGAYLESAAFNPGLPPLQAALASAVRAGLASYNEIVDVVLVELSDATVQFAPTSALLLKHIAPSATLELVDAEWDP